LVLNRFFILFFCIGISTAQAHTGNADLHSLSQTPAWRALLHYFDSSKSEVLGHDYFLSPTGNTDPEEELRETVSEFEQSSRTIGPLLQTPYCAFPARLQWLEENGFQFPHQECPDQIDFLKNIAPKSLTLVFSSAYPNNPASLFGHTMIRMNKGKGDPLTDYGVNFSAEVPANETGIKYVLKGLFGFYPGIFNVQPFYQKVLEYNETESRDLWEFDLNFSESESIFWTKHLWELRFLSQFSYTFSAQNCSYQIIRSLEVIRPEIRSWLPQNIFYVLPGETIRHLKDDHPELFNEVHFRPSHFRILKNRYRFLNSEQKSKFKNLLGHPELLQLETDPYVLEALNSYYEYRTIQQEGHPDQNMKDLLRSTRVTRAKLGGVTHFPLLTGNEGQTNRPDLAHGTYQFALTSHFGKWNTSEGGLRARFGLHDLLNRDDGYEANFGVTGGEVELTWAQHSASSTNALRLRKLKLFDFISLQPVGIGQYPVSWHVFSGWNPMLERDPLGLSSVFETGGGVGLTFEAITDHLSTGFFFNASSKIDSDIPEKKWASISVEPFLLVRINERLKAKFTFTLENDFEFSAPPGLRTSSELAWDFAKQFELRAADTEVMKSYVMHQELNQFSLELGWFF
jgi:hypothetical protein